MNQLKRALTVVVANSVGRNQWTKGSLIYSSSILRGTKICIMELCPSYRLELLWFGYCLFGWCFMTELTSWLLSELVAWWQNYSHGSISTISIWGQTLGHPSISSLGTEDDGWGLGLLMPFLHFVCLFEGFPNKYVQILRAWRLL